MDIVLSRSRDRLIFGRDCSELRIEASGGIAMYLGLDLGTSGLKGVLIDDDQNIVDTASAGLEVSRPQAGWSEQNPADWIAAAEAVLDALKAGQDLGSVKGIGLSVKCMGPRRLTKKTGFSGRQSFGMTPAVRMKRAIWTQKPIGGPQAGILSFQASPRRS